MVDSCPGYSTILLCTLSDIFHWHTQLCMGTQYSLNLTKVYHLCIFGPQIAQFKGLYSFTSSNLKI